MIATATPSRTAPIALADLERMKAEWLIEGMTVMEDLMTVVREMGVPTAEHGRNLIRFNEGSVQAIYYDHPGSFLPAKQQYSRSTSVSVWAGADQVCSLTTTNDPYHMGNARAWNIFIPGKWTKTLLAHLADAKMRAANREAQQLDAKRRELEQRLLIGKTV